MTAPQSPGKPKTLIIDKKFKPEELRIPRNQTYIRDLGQCFKVFQKWGFDIIWVDSGIDAMKALKQYQNDIKSIIIEAYVPGGGLTIARLIRFRPECRSIPVFIMAQQLTDSDQKEIKRIEAQKVLMRPFQDLNALEKNLKHGVEAQGKLADAQKGISPRDHIVKELEKITNLPAMPTVYNEIEKLSQDPDATTEEYSEIIELDPAITAQMLRLCNSSAFSFSRKITTVNDAVNLLGLQTVLDFVRTLSVVGAFKGKATAFDSTEFWKHCISVGMSATLLCEHPEFKNKFDIGNEDPFMAGMVHDIGKQVMGYFFNDMYQMVLDEMKSGLSMFAVEKNVLGLTHQDVGEGLAIKWQLPDDLVSVIGHHHDPNEETSEMSHLIHLSNACGKLSGFTFAERTKEMACSEMTLEKFGTTQESAEKIFKELEPTVRKRVAETFAAIFS